MLTDEQVEACLNRLRESRIGLLFQLQENRTQVAKAAKAAGITTFRRMSYNQQLDPRYTVESSHIPDRGLANDYNHFFSKLYALETYRY